MIIKMKSIINKLLPMNKPTHEPTQKPYYPTQDEVVFKMWIKGQMRKDKFKFTNLGDNKFELRTIDKLNCWNIFEGVDGSQCYSRTEFDFENEIKDIIIFENLFEFDKSLDS